MRLFHLSDLHIGKRVNEFSMIEDQKYILERILDLAEKEMPDGVVIISFCNRPECITFFYLDRRIIAVIDCIITLFIRHNQSLSEKAGHNHYNHNKGYQILLHTASSFVSSESKLTFANICSVSNSITRTYVCQFFFGIFRTKVCFFPYFMVLCIQMKKGGIS